MRSLAIALLAAACLPAAAFAETFSLTTSTGLIVYGTIPALPYFEEDSLGGAIYELVPVTLNGSPYTTEAIGFFNPALASRPLSDDGEGAPFEFNIYTPGNNNIYGGSIPLYTGLDSNRSTSQAPTTCLATPVLSTAKPKSIPRTAPPQRSSSPTPRCSPSNRPRNHPEPSSLILLGSGLTAMYGAMRRRVR